MFCILLYNGSQSLFQWELSLELVPSVRSTGGDYITMDILSHLQHRIGLQQAVFDSLHLVAGRTGDCIVLQDLLGRLRLPSSTFPRDQDALVLPFCPHGAVGVVCYSIAAKRGSTEFCRIVDSNTNDGQIICLRYLYIKYRTRFILGYYYYYYYCWDNMLEIQASSKPVMSHSYGDRDDSSWERSQKMLLQ